MYETESLFMNHPVYCSFHAMYFTQLRVSLITIKFLSFAMVQLSSSFLRDTLTRRWMIGASRFEATYWFRLQGLELSATNQ